MVTKRGELGGGYRHALDEPKKLDQKRQYREQQQAILHASGVREATALAENLSSI